MIVDDCGGLTTLSPWSREWSVVRVITLMPGHLYCHLQTKFKCYDRALGSRSQQLYFTSGKNFMFGLSYHSLICLHLPYVMYMESETMCVTITIPEKNIRK